jgi:hypothetical protein
LARLGVHRIWSDRLPNSPTLSTEVDCWPRINCTDRSFGSAESGQVFDAISAMVASTVECAAVKEKAWADYWSGDLKMWDSGYYGYYGDRHNSVSLTHVTPLAFENGPEFLTSIITHETMHALGYSHAAMAGKCGSFQS